MNERIKTLAKVAGYDEINKAAMKLTGFDPEKFAELIVREYSYDVMNLTAAPEHVVMAARHWGVEL